MVYSDFIALIPARLGSLRFPGKILTEIAGKPMIQWVYEQTSKSNVTKTIVATDSQRIVDCVTGFGGEAIITSADHPTGTDRIAEVASKLTAPFIINVQGDEPLITPAIINELIDVMRANKNISMATVAVPFSGKEDHEDPNVVKVVTDALGYAMYFSRSPIPYVRDENENPGVSFLRHWGIYAFCRKFLMQFVSWDQGTWEKAEKLEQLRALEHGIKPFVCIVEGEGTGVDTPEDIKKVESILCLK